MSDERPSGPPDPEPDWKRRRRLAEIFGDVLPSVTTDERDEPDGRGDEAGRAADEATTDQWLRSQVPPHHG
ncbi:hypothetical protein [Nocardioides sp. SYSU DS0651]|uniref:hypothetical protein n=1 Tax=Nocardioides sp. SYSU DS0651 TaxID=3415955 RepID=UPI003F4C1D42